MTRHSEICFHAIKPEMRRPDEEMMIILKFENYEWKLFNFLELYSGIDVIQTSPTSLNRAWPAFTVGFIFLIVWWASQDASAIKGFPFPFWMK